MRNTADATISRLFTYFSLNLYHILVVLPIKQLSPISFGLKDVSK